MSTFADETAADVPVKDITLNLTKVGVGLSEMLVAQNARARQAILRVSREELEDRFLRLHEENLLLKQHTHKQEDKIKRMATKLVRLVKDRRRVEQVAAGGVRPGSRDMELEEMMEELQEKVQELQMQNEGLKQRLLAAKQQLQTQSKRPTPYGHVQSRVNTGLRRLREDTFSLAQLPPAAPRGPRSVEVEMSGRAPQGLLPRYGHSLLDDARAEIRNLENVIETQRSHIEEMDKAAELLRDQLRRKERKFEESLLHLREQQTTGQRSTIKDNVEMIRLQKQLVEKGNAFTVLEGRFLQLQESQRTLKVSHEAVMAKVDELMGQLKDERLRSLGLESQLQANSFSQRRTEELQEQIFDLEKERVLLKENCDKLVNSAFDVSQDQTFRMREQQLKLQIAQLELALKSDLTDKNEILDKIKVERDMNEKLSQEKEDIQLRFLEQKQQLDEIRDRIKFYTKESEVDVAELSEALMLIKVRKSQRSGELGFLEQVEEEVRSDTEHSVRELQATHAETIQELEKTRNMLIVQHKINKDYQAEVEAVTRKMDDSKLQYELKLERLAQLLDMRAAKIKKLEAQLKDIAYGTKSHVFKPEVTDDDVADEFDETVHLERGENLLEIHIGMATLSPIALETLSDREPSTFCTYAFYDFELQATPVVRGARPAYSFTSQYVVRVDDLFLQYLHTGSVTLELQLARGMDFTTVAVGQLRLSQLLENNSKTHGIVQLVGVAGEVQSFGSVVYWVRLRVPMEQAIRLYKERVKALGYLSSAFNAEQQVSTSTLTPHSVSADGGMNLNELNVTVRCCSNLTSRHAHPPSPYVVYQFYDFPDHDTCIVGDCSQPQFEDNMSFPVAMEAELDSYLKAGALLLYVFDDHDTQSEMYLGKARVPLLSLAHDKAITGTFELTDPSGLPSGHIDVTLKWKFTYLPPPGSTMTVEQAKFVPKERPVKLTTRKVEEKKVEVEEKRREEEEKREGKKEELRMVVKEEKRAKALIPLPTTSTASEMPLPKPRIRTFVKEKTASKKVSFVDVTAPGNQESENVSCPSILPGTEKREVSKLPPLTKVVTGSAVAPEPPQSTTEEEDDEEESHFSEGQVIVASSQSTSDESDISEEILEQMEDLEAAPVAEDEEQSESILSDSDDCIVPGQSSMGRKPSERVRVEIVSLSLRPESRAAADCNVVRLFVEYSLLDMPSEETPLSLPKPSPGITSHYNYSNVIHVDKENNKSRREILRGVLEGRNPQMESIRFTVVSEPPEEEEQEKECEDVGVAFFRIPDILEQQQDLIETSLNIVDVQDSSVVVGSLCVSVEGLEALQSIMEDADHDYTPLSSLEQKAEG
ncbi:protein fantom isoform X2 [Oncorhynchus kisutch]|uniref:RPGRIP1 like n=1 Tax=Oncorhynchus kisutch TaxID=8019 RepID=A0A8C7DW84_ONCKI|nr:protein fantom isoform X2 [Oncorhynchus kisutch]